MSSIRHLAGSYDGAIFATAEFKSVVHLWDLLTLTKLNVFETVLDFGGSRLAISPDGKIVVTGAYEKEGIAAYRASDGVELWRRKDLKKVQQLQFDREGHRLWCCFDEGGSKCLEAKDGKSALSLRGVKRLWESQFGSAQIFCRSADLAISYNLSEVVPIPKASFAVLKAAFSESQVCISEAGGPVRVFSLSSAKEVWRHDPKKGVHFLNVAFSYATETFVGVSWPFEKGGPSILTDFNKATGTAHPICEVDSPEIIFCKKGSRLVTRLGTVVETKDGRIAGRFAFPE